VGMALGSHWLAARYNKSSFPLFGFNVYALAGDGCMMEGVSGEAASLAGHLRLSNLCWIYDNNHITIEGNTSLAFSEDVAGRFLAYGWNVERVSNANDLDLLREAFDQFKKTTDRPTLIIVDSHIGYGAPTKQDTSAAHGEPLGEEEVKAAKRRYGWPEDAKFLVPPEVSEDFKAKIGKRGAQLRSEWMALFSAYEKEYPELANETLAIQHREAPTLGRRDPIFSRGSEGDRKPGFFWQGPQRHSKASPVVAGRLGGSRSIHQDTSDLRGCRRRESRLARRKKLALRCTGACNGIDPQWTGADKTQGVWLGLPHLQRLWERVPAPRSDHGAARDLRFYA